MHLAVIVDAVFKDEKTFDAVFKAMLSRATTVDNLLMTRDPGLDFLARGPSADLAVRPRAFSPRAR
eukprot:9047246-Pyramimonas_sp.AAC.1